MTETTEETPLVKTLRADFEQFEDCYLRHRDNAAHPDFMFCNRLWRLFDTVARHAEDAHAF